MKKIILFAITLICFNFSYSQENDMVYPSNQTSMPASCNFNASNTNSYCLNIKFHIFRNNNQTGGLNPNQLTTILNNLNAGYSASNISFVSLGYDFIDNTNLGSNVAVNYFSPVFNVNNISNAINFYIVLSTVSGNEGFAQVGNNNLVLPYYIATSPKFSCHELGHCLRLLHTFSGSSYALTESCLDIGSNCSTCGDFLCDTPLDSNQGIQVGFNPDLTNYMSYYAVRNHFTNGQSTRMRNQIECNMQYVRSHQCDIVSGPANICPNNSYTYTLTTFGTPTVVWTSSPNLPINGSNSGLTVSVQPSANTSGQTGTVTATINGTIVKTFIVKIGLQIINNGYINGTYDWVSVNYGPMGLIASGNASIASYQWALTTESGYPPSCAPGNVQAKFANGSQSYSSTSPNVIVNWGSCKGSYILSCYVTTICGESLLYGEYITDVGDPRNNPCFTDALRAVIAPNPISDGVIKVSVSKTLNMMPCNFKTYTQTSIDYKMDEINNHVLVHDYNGNQIYEQYYETDEITIADINLTRGNYIVTLISKEGFTDQQVIIVE